MEPEWDQSGPILRPERSRDEAWKFLDLELFKDSSGNQNPAAPTERRSARGKPNLSRQASRAKFESSMLWVNR
jgi:hypothetical protein